MKSRIAAIAAAAALMLMTAACDSGPAPAATPAQAPSATVEPEPVTVRVPVKSVDVHSAGIALSGASAAVVLNHGLPNACHTYDSSTVDTSSLPRIVLDVFNLKKTGVPCAEIYQIIETRIPLAQPLERCVFYTVEINGNAREAQALDPKAPCA